MGGDGRRYEHCGVCDLISLQRVFLPDREKEKARYLEHQNGIEHAGHVKFLNQAIEPALPFLRSGMRGLDFGCGPIPTLSRLLAAKGFPCDDYDPLFFDAILSVNYDFVFSTEVLEHLFEPSRDIEKIKSLIKPGGLWVVMTELWVDLEKFKIWHYARDLTHVCFYHSRTFDLICQEFGFELIFNDGHRVLIFRNSSASKK